MISEAEGKLGLVKGALDRYGAAGGRLGDLSTVVADAGRQERFYLGLKIGPEIVRQDLHVLVGVGDRGRFFLAQGKYTPFSSCRDSAKVREEVSASPRQRPTVILRLCSQA